MIWVALATGFVVAAVLAAWRWRARPHPRAEALGRRPAGVACAGGLLFVDAAVQRARTDFKPDTPVAQSFADDPRLALWQHTFERIRERPWTGFGFGKSILAEELRGELHDPMLAHAHNLFVSQWLQTGAIGVAALVAMLAALTWCFLDVPARDRRYARGHRTRRTRHARDLRREEPDRRFHDPSDQQGVLGAIRFPDRLRRAQRERTWGAAQVGTYPKKWDVPS